MNQRNYQKELDYLIAQNRTKQKVPSLYLHSCCAPCSSYVLEYLSEYFRITVFYYNPNIYPKEEYWKRVEEQQRLITQMPFSHSVQFAEGEFDERRFYETVRGLEKEPEGGARCEQCFRLRLAETAKRAKEAGADYFATTLTISPLKNASLINQIGEELAAEYGISWLPSDFKKKNGYKRSTELSATYGLYRQDYCGCVFSVRK
ncbi:MAG: epoxyqueuosine reductase QueH [Marvinbryantia sp.]|jgi:predicted adenine nucleotide alpha hydrolase (AANH) superfamily ATPase